MGKGRVFYLYTYDLKRETASKKVRFVYLLKGRGEEKGFVKQMNGEFLAPGCFMILEKHVKEMDQIFKLWQIKKKSRRILLMG